MHELTQPVYKWSLLFTPWATIPSYLLCSSTAIGILSPKPISSVHKSDPLWFALGPASLEADSHSWRIDPLMAGKGQGTAGQGGRRSLCSGFQLRMSLWFGLPPE